MARFSEELEELGRPEAERRAEQTSESAETKVDPTAPRERMSRASVMSMQHRAGNRATAAVLQRETAAERSPVHNVIGSGGTALDEETRTTMEQHLGADLSDVRLHVDKESAESVDAAAYTVGNDVVLHPGHFSPGTPAAQRTLAHELTHVVQQRSGPVEGTPREGGIRVSDPSDRFEQEAERSADQLMSAQRSTASSASPADVQRAALSVQRDDDEDVDVQELALQREGEDETEGEDSDDTMVMPLALQREGEEDADDEDSDDTMVMPLALQREGEDEADEEDPE
jgi:Domain of unknown function (DUF4157)